MIIEQKKYSKEMGWVQLRPGDVPAAEFDLVLVFGARHLLSDHSFFHSIRQMYPAAQILMSSTAGEITGSEVNDDTISLTAIKFEKAVLRTVVIDIADVKNSFEAGYRIASEMNTEHLVSVLIISDGQEVNGSELVLGLQEFLPKEVLITGGLAGDGAQFRTTLVGLNEPPSKGKIAAIGFYGRELLVKFGSIGGWDPFGPIRLITRSQGNVLYELDGKPALDVYKMYLGEYINELPGSALLFPLSIRTPHSEQSVVRTILSVNETDHSLTFAGNIPQGDYAQLMKANFDRLIDGASNAAIYSMEGEKRQPELAILISCVGRKLVLGQRVEEEVEAVRSVYGEATVIAGFYSYGEIAPSFRFGNCELHNQTMTITTMTEML